VREFRSSLVQDQSKKALTPFRGLDTKHGPNSRREEKQTAETEEEGSSHEESDEEEEVQAGLPVEEETEEDAGADLPENTQDERGSFHLASPLARPLVDQLMKLQRPHTTNGTPISAWSPIEEHPFRVHDEL
jgi:hypothetical protein